MADSIKNIYIFRHGETAWNAEHRVQGHIDTDLNENGVVQAKVLALKFANISLDAIYSSDLKRAHQTALEVAKNFDIEVKTDQRLREAYMGDAQGKTREEIIDQFGAKMWDEFRCLNLDNLDASMPNGETRRAQIERFLSFFEDHVFSGEHQNIAIGCHGGVLRNIMHHQFPGTKEHIVIHNCCCYLVKIEGNRFIDYKLFH